MFIIYLQINGSESSSVSWMENRDVSITSMLYKSGVKVRELYQVLKTLYLYISNFHLLVDREGRREIVKEMVCA